MRPELALQTLRLARRSTMWWIAGIGLFLVVNVATWPAIEGQSGYDDLLDDMPEAMLALFGIEGGMSITSPGGFLVSQVFGFILPLLLAVLAVTVGSRAIAGEEEQHTLDLLLAQPVSRGRVYGEKFAAMTAIVIGVGVASWFVLVISCAVVGLPVGIVDLGVATAADVLFGLQTGALALAVGAATGRRAAAIALASAVALAGVVLESLAAVSSPVASVRWLAPFHFVNGNIPLLHGLRPIDAAVLAGLTAAAGFVGLVLFGRRDVAS
jgi:ABC-2 type transport system permease protein